ncbi:MAG: hypothetical protein OXC12_13375 [Spirochaetaceae bacterium]|nr:hypothetical protein [Spirochaetaceae bacterium]
MVRLRRMLRSVLWTLRGVQVTALVGKSGTGKSFRAQLIAQKYGIDVIVDDGLLIQGQKILAGRSAKRERGAIEAVKAAVFHDETHAREVLRVLERIRAQRILILATSEKMAVRIAGRLDLPRPQRIISIEDVATEEEIDAALRSRRAQGRHIIPVPPIEVRRDYGHIVIDSITIFLRNKILRRRGKVFEKTVVSPQFERRGSVTVSEAALTQMVLHCVGEFAPEFAVERLVVVGDLRQPGLEVMLRVPFDVPVAGRLHQLRDYIISSVERFSGLLLDQVDITVDQIEGAGPPDASTATDGGKPEPGRRNRRPRR